MTIFFALVHQEDDSAFGAQFPDVPGCFSAADRLDDLPREASQALALYFEDEDLVSPRSMDQLHNDTDVKEALAEGAFLLGIPLISLQGRTVAANISLDKGLLASIDETAKARGMNRSAYLAGLAQQDILAG